MISLIIKCKWTQQESFLSTEADWLAGVRCRWLFPSNFLQIVQTFLKVSFRQQLCRWSAHLVSSLDLALFAEERTTETASVVCRGPWTSRQSWSQSLRRTSKEVDRVLFCWIDSFLPEPGGDKLKLASGGAVTVWNHKILRNDSKYLFGVSLNSWLIWNLSNLYLKKLWNI